MSKNPSSRLPVDVLEEIFSSVADRIKLHVRQPHRAGSHSPWDLALVCKDWRDIVLSTPCLWSNISLNLIPPIRTPHKCDALVSTWNLCLERSHNHSLTIELIASTREGETNSQIPPFLEPLMANVQRWEAITFHVSLNTLLPYLSNSPAQYSRLRRLRIYNGSCKPKENAVGLFRDAPLLSCIHLSYLPYYGQRLGGIGIPWSQISHLKINVYFGTFNDLMDILENTPNLVTLNYAIMHNYFGEGGLPQLELSYLQQIVWTSYHETGYDDADGPATSEFFGLLKAPQLSALEVDGACGDRELEAIRGCLQRSGCSITSLKLPTARLSSLLSLTPDIKTLVFEDTPTLDDGNSITNNTFSDDPLFHSKLVHLQKVVLIGHCGPGAISLLLRLLEASQLSVLEVVGVCGDRELEAIRSCLQRSKCSITSLKLPTPRLSSLLSFTPHVETLVLPCIDKEVLMSLFKELTFDHSASSWLCPKLRKIVLDFDIAAGPLFNAFITMLKSRLWAPPNSVVRLRCYKLKELELGYGVSKHMRQWVQKRLTSQESLVITYEGQNRLRDRWDF